MGSPCCCTSCGRSWTVRHVSDRFTGYLSLTTLESNCVYCVMMQAIKENNPVYIKNLVTPMWQRISQVNLLRSAGNDVPKFCSEFGRCDFSTTTPAEWNAWRSINDKNCFKTVLPTGLSPSLLLFGFLRSRLNILHEWYDWNSILYPYRLMHENVANKYKI